MSIRSAKVLAIASLGLAGCASVPGSPADTQPAAGLSEPRFLVKRDAEVRVDEAGPHEGTGRTTAFRYFDELQDAALVFRKRALHPGASIGEHALSHDEVYYVLSGRGELTVDRTHVPVGPDTAVFMRIGATVGLRQLGDEDLVIVIAYPPPPGQ